ncbi:MAG: TetR family transcriptional regulator [Candidatus Nephthysia bennettiae]|uniref:TetR/AcrR family transcriptional regulator n=1 Tax=Candidatus Nephthysia bennettiae TaxID=3127016 RepID=A0A934K1P8_9BACT|nr:TetR/AcrR family transcriptional regulator [Candidatus Dormibacteraeota bacterium]MBJ7613235.1 TetR/AcrR family transcriptional regulator [Candidatus Dormibacteraeota bacterium]PZR96054.1 MAG: TetR family transcriptional regulator [Candidatus Dormibacteraeota bacterium]
MKRRTQRERAGTTRGALIAAASELFAERGYHQVAADSVARRAGVTSGALYHHFRDKRDLFGAAVDAAEARLARRVAGAAAAGQDPWERLQLGIVEYLEACSEPGSGRLLFLDAPSILGAGEWRRIQTTHHLRPLRAALAGAMRAGFLERQPPDPLARLLLGALGEASIAPSPEQGDLRVAALWLLGRLRRPAGAQPSLV